MKKCPFCAEDIQDEAIKCRHCGSVLSAPLRGSSDEPQAAGQTVSLADHLPTSAPSDEFEDIRALARQGQKIKAIKTLRAKTGWSLSRAKDFVEGIEGGSGGTGLDGTVARKSRGLKRGVGVVVAVVGLALVLIFPHSAQADASSGEIAALGILLLWFGFGFALPGRVIARWGGGLVLAMVIGYGTSHDSVPSTASAAVSHAEAAPVAPAITVEAGDLFAEYKANEVAADMKYKDKVLEVSGTVERIAKDITNTMYITLKGDKFVGNVQCFFADANASQLASLHVGTEVSVKGKCSGKMMNVLLKGCALTWVASSNGTTAR